MAVDPRTLKVGDVYRDSDGDKCTVVSVDENSVEVTVGNLKGSIILEWNDKWFNIWPWDTAEIVSRASSVESKTAPVVGHPRFLALLDKMREIHIAKSADYGADADPFANYRRAERLGLNTSQGILLRMEDKMARIETWANGGELKNEGVIDSLMDLASYALCAVVLIEEEQAK